MNTVTLTPELYNGIKIYADRENVSVQDFIITLITRTYPIKAEKKKIKIKEKSELSPVLQNILNMPKIREIPSDDINGTELRKEYYNEKYGNV